MKKSILFSLFFVFAFVISLNSYKSYAAVPEYEFQYKTLPYLQNEEVEITGYTGYAKNLVIPEKIGVRSVISLGDIRNDFVEKLVLPSSLHSFPSNHGIIPGDYQSIDNTKSWNLFHGLTHLKSIQVLGANSFFSSENGILYDIFREKELTCVPVAYQGKVTIGSDVATIDDRAFDGCTDITEFVVDENNKIYHSQDGVLYKGTTLIKYPPAKEDKQFCIPKEVKELHARAFGFSKNLECVTISGGLSKVSEAAFENCKALKKVTMKKGIKEIGNYAFCDCSNLSKVIFPEGLKAIGMISFKGTKAMKKIVLPSTCYVALATGLKVAKNGTVQVNSPRLKLDYYNDYTGEEISGQFGDEGKYTYIGYKSSRLYKEMKQLKYVKCKPIKGSMYKNPVKQISKGVKGTGKPDITWYKKSKKVYRISTPDQLAGLGILLKKGVEKYNFFDKKIILTKNLNMSCYKNFSPLGSNKNFFAGTFDGNHKVIYNVTIHAYQKDNIGLFSENRGLIKNLTLRACNIYGGVNVGPFAGVCEKGIGKIVNCKAYGRVKRLD